MGSKVLLKTIIYRILRKIKHFHRKPPRHIIGAFDDKGRIQLGFGMRKEDLKLFI